MISNPKELLKKMLLAQSSYYKALFHQGPAGSPSFPFLSPEGQAALEGRASGCLGRRPAGDQHSQKSSNKGTRFPGEGNVCSAGLVCMDWGWVLEGLLPQQLSSCGLVFDLM